MAVRTVTFSADSRAAPGAGAGVGPVIRPSVAALLPILAGSQMQLQATAEKTHGTMQDFIEQTMETMRAQSERSDKLEAELIAARSQRTAEALAHASQLKALQELLETMNTSLTNRMASFEDRLSVVVTAVQGLEDRYNAHDHNGIVYQNIAGRRLNMGLGALRHPSTSCKDLDKKSAR